MARSWSFTGFQSLGPHQDYPNAPVAPTLEIRPSAQGQTRSGGGMVRRGIDPLLRSWQGQAHLVYAAQEE